ncbi:class I SAM-dependent methyltransferase [Elusimicrobiota bacterium]
MPVSIISNVKKLTDVIISVNTRFSRLGLFLGVDAQKVKELYRELEPFACEIAQKDQEFNGKNMLSQWLTMYSPLRGQVLYVVCRILKPKAVVETGVANGTSSAFILKALEANESGMLYSIDLPNQPGENIPREKTSGWLVPGHLRSRWQLQLGDTRELLQPLLERLGKVDCFFHDSDHSHKNMLFEFKTAWDHITAGGILAADDISLNNAFSEFALSVNKTPFKVYHRFGLLRK